LLEGDGWLIHYILRPARLFFFISWYCSLFILDSCLYYKCIDYNCF